MIPQIGRLPCPHEVGTRLQITSAGALKPQVIDAALLRVYDNSMAGPAMGTYGAFIFEGRPCNSVTGTEDISTR